MKHQSWGEIASQPEFAGVNRTTLWAFYHGKEPHDPEIRRRLGLPAESRAHVVAGVVPPGSQTIGARQCVCGRWFIPNHPRRRKCFICSPPKPSG